MHAELTRDGLVIGGFWVARGTLPEGVDVPSDTWELMTRAPERHWLIVPDEGHVLSIDELLARNIRAHVATYRIRDVGQTDD
jgi:hypothetical protein